MVQGVGIYWKSYLGRLLVSCKCTNECQEARVVLWYVWNGGFA